jgi:hypothetical protein
VKSTNGHKKLKVVKSLFQIVVLSLHFFTSFVFNYRSEKFNTWEVEETSRSSTTATRTARNVSPRKNKKGPSHVLLFLVLIFLCIAGFFFKCYCIELRRKWPTSRIRTQSSDMSFKYYFIFDSFFFWIVLLTFVCSRW